MAGACRRVVLKCQVYREMFVHGIGLETIHSNEGRRTSYVKYWFMSSLLLYGFVVITRARQTMNGLRVLIQIGWPFCAPILGGANACRWILRYGVKRKVITECSLCYTMYGARRTLRHGRALCSLPAFMANTGEGRDFICFVWRFRRQQQDG